MKSVILIFLVLTSQICLAQKQIKNKKPVTAIVLGKSLTDRGRSKKEPHTTVLAILMQKYVKDNKIKVTEDEIKDFTSYSIKMREKERVESEADRDKLVKELESETLDEKERKKKTSQLQTIERHLKSEREDAKILSQEMMNKIYRDLAKETIFPWKIKKSLYKKYGGRVVTRTFSVEPIDAYYKFLKEQEKAGAFQLVDDEFAAQFWNYFTNYKHHIFLSKEEGDKFINTPLWLLQKTDRSGNHKNQQ